MSIPIVGNRERHSREAHALSAILPFGAKVWLHWEPENPYDPNAVAVRMHRDDLKLISAHIVQTVLGPLGYSTQDILRVEWWHLGYIPAKWPRAGLDLPAQGTISFTARGNPQVEGL